MVIHFISRNHLREIHQKDIEEELSIRKPTASQLLDRMEKSGLVERRVSSKDKRRNQIILTDKAIDSVKQIKHVLKDIEKTLQQDLTEDEIATFLQVVEKMKKIVPEYISKNSPYEVIDSKNKIYAKINWKYKSDAVIRCRNNFFDRIAFYAFSYKGSEKV